MTVPEAIADILGKVDRAKAAGAGRLTVSEPRWLWLDGHSHNAGKVRAALNKAGVFTTTCIGFVILDW